MLTTANIQEITELARTGAEGDLARAASLAAQLGPLGPAFDDQIVIGLINIGLELEVRGQHALAAGLYQRVVDHDAAWSHFRANAALRLGTTLIQAGDKTGAATAFQAAAAWAANSTVTRLSAYHGGYLLTELGRYEEALEMFQRLRDLAPGSPDEPSQLIGQVMVATARVRLGHAEALPVLPGELNTLEGIALFELAEALDRAGRADEAAGLFGTLLAGDVPPWTRQSAIARLREQLAQRKDSLSPAASVSAVFAQVCRLVHGGTGEPDLTEAGRLCELLSQIASDHPNLVVRAMMMVAREMGSIGQPESASRLYRTVLAFPHIDLQNLQIASFWLGLLEAAAGSVHQAVELLRTAITDNSNLLVVRPAVETLVELHGRLGEWSEARGVIEELSEKIANGDPQEGLFWELRGVHIRAHENDIDEYDVSAASLLPDTLPEQPRTANAWMAAASALQACGFLSQARVFYEQLLSCPTLPPGVRTRALYRLGTVLDRLMMFREAQDYLHAAAFSEDGEPEVQSEARLRLANLRFLMDEFAEVIDDFRVLAATGASGSVRAESQLKYATCLVRLGRKAEARAELNESRTSILAGTEFEVKADLMLAELAEGEGDLQEATACYKRIIHNPLSEPLTKAAALARVSELGKKRRKFI